ncbi:unnamed protein product [Coregonus sp. 'balchen']|nr:unnamed protein product [Coregonus sp. 'balchen']
MYKLQLLNVFLNEKLTAVPLEISVALVKKTIAEHQEEICRLRRANARLRRLLDLVFKPEINYVTASKMLLLCKGLQLVTAENQWTVTVQKVKELVAALCSAMDRKFLRMEYNTVLSETTLLDPRFKKLAFSDRRAVDEALQRISAAAAAKCTPSSQPAPPLQGQVEEEQQTSAVWRLFDDRATGDASRRNPTADAIMEFHPFFPPDLQQLTLSEEEVNRGQQHCEQEWRASLGPVEFDAVESIWDSINIITVENQTESEDESNRESQSTSDYQPPSDVNPDSEGDNEKVDGVVSRIPPSGLKPLRSKGGRRRPRKHQ